MLTELNTLAQSLAQTWLAFSVVLAVQIGLVLLLRKPVRARLGAVACYRLWLLPLLCLPFYLAGPALMQQLASLNAFVAQPDTQTVSNLQQFIDFELLPFDINAEFAGLSAGGDPVVNGWLVLLLVWGMGTLALLAWQGRRWLDFSRQVAALAAPLPEPERKRCGAAVHFSSDVPVLSLRGMGGAALFGVFKPVLLLSESFCQRYDNNQRHIILAHEAVHLRRGDNAWNLGAMLLMALFWTNPLVLLAWRHYRLDQELACDALALTRCNSEQQKRYARTLLDSLRSLSSHTAQPGLTAWDDLGDIKERSLMIKHHLRTATRPVVVLFSLLALTVLGASLTVTFAELVSPAAEAAEPAQQSRAVQREIQQAPRPVTQEDPDVSEQQTGRILSRAIEFLNTDRFAEARATLDELRLESLSPFERSRFHQLMFNIEMNVEDYPAARAQLQLALDSGGLNAQEDSQLRYQMAQLYVQEEKYADAADALEAWIAAEETPNPAAYYLLAASYYYQEMFDEALPNAQMSVDLAGDAPQEGWLSMLASLLIQKADYVAATPVIQRMVNMFPDKDTYWAQLSGLYLQQEQYVLAETIVAQMVERFPDKEAYQKQLEDLKALNAQ
jgi:beta-lactamase regulating signal transducer with metallopeptidase domain